MKIFEGKVLIDGNWQDPESGETLPVMDPSDGREYGRIARGSDADINSAVQAAQYSMDNEWGDTVPVERGRLLQKLRFDFCYTCCVVSHIVNGYL